MEPCSSSGRFSRRAAQMISVCRTHKVTINLCLFPSGGLHCGWVVYYHSQDKIIPLSLRKHKKNNTIYTLTKNNCIQKKEVGWRFLACLVSMFCWTVMKRSSQSKASSLPQWVFNRPRHVQGVLFIITTGGCNNPAFCFADLWICSFSLCIEVSLSREDICSVAKRWLAALARLVVVAVIVFNLPENISTGTLLFLCLEVVWGMLSIVTTAADVQPVRTKDSQSKGGNDRLCFV